LTCHEFVGSLGRAAPPGPDEEVTIEPGDRFLMLSDSWNAFDELAPVFQRIRAQGGEIVTCIFDLIPELYPHACHEVTVPRYDAWLRKALLESDSFIAISRTVADELAAFVKGRGLPHRPGLKIGWFHCGSDITNGASGEAREKIRAAVVGDAPVFLSVGTIEPRKGQRVALSAFEQLWAQDFDARLVFVGRRGWFEEAVIAEITGHSEFGRRLFWFDDVGDEELSFLYDRAAALILASYAEGFGLPIVEAARRGRPVICSDIPVFREVGGAGAIYFRVNDPAALAASVRGFVAGELEADPAQAPRASWADAARRIVSVIAHDEWSNRLP
jgi:glycosyltransferase involved in cell wall biosynthesis